MSLRCSAFMLVALLSSLVASTAFAIPLPVNIESTPAGARVFLDNADGAPLGVTPLKAVRIEKGQHTLIFRLDNHEEQRLPINVKKRRETFRVTLNPVSTIVITAGGDTAVGASVRIDGQSLGNVPYTGTVRPGRHLLEVRREGYVPFTQWIDGQAGQGMTIPVILSPERPDTGSVLVAGDVSGAPIFIDNQPKGVTPGVIEDIAVGTHTLEVRPAGLPVHSQQIMIQAGRREVVNFTLNRAAQGGSLRVIANVPSAEIRLDGEVLGPAPVTREGVTPGEHILEAQAAGYQPVQQPVSVEPGRQRVVSLELKPVTQAPGRIVVNANIGNSVVSIDGTEKGAPPVVVAEAAAGTHAVVITATGYDDFRTTCNVAPGQDCNINAELHPVGTPIRVIANVNGAELLVDGESRGPVPYEGSLPAGAHRIEVRAEGYNPHVEQVSLAPAAEPREFNVALSKVGDSPEERARAANEASAARRGAVSHAAGILPQDLAVLDLSIGWPHVVEGRLNVGILDFLEGGFAIRSFGRLTEFELRAEMGVRPVQQVAASVQVRTGGGIGPRKVNSMFLTAEALGSLYFTDRGAFTLFFGLDLYTDKYPYTAENAEEPISMTTPVDEIDRQNQARIRLGGTVDVVINRHWNVFGLLEGILVDEDDTDPNNGRRLYGDLLGIGGTDTKLYFRAGFSHKF